jgi:hypothetical protein
LLPSRDRRGAALPQLDASRIQRMHGVVDGGVTVVEIAERGSSPVDRREELELSVFLYVSSMTSVRVDVCDSKRICLGCGGTAVHIKQELETPYKVNMNRSRNIYELAERIRGRNRD